MKIETLRGGLTSLAAQQLIVMGTFFVLPVYLQVAPNFGGRDTWKPTPENGSFHDSF